MCFFSRESILHLGMKGNPLSTSFLEQRSPSTSVRGNRATRGAKKLPLPKPSIPAGCFREQQ